MIYAWRKCVLMLKQGVVTHEQRELLHAAVCSHTQTHLSACGYINACTHEQFNSIFRKLFWGFFVCCGLILICVDVLTS